MPAYLVSDITLSPHLRFKLDRAAISDLRTIRTKTIEDIASSLQLFDHEVADILKALQAAGIALPLSADARFALYEASQAVTHSAP